MIVEAKRRGVGKVAVHALLDGRDVGETSALDYLEPFEAWISGVDPNYGLASGGGRMSITMDRYDADWSMVERGWKISWATTTRADRVDLSAFPIIPDQSACIAERTGLID